MSRLPQCALNVPSDQMMMENLEKNGFHHQHRARSYSCVNLGWINGVTQYWSRNLCGFAYYRSTESSMSYGHHTSLVVRVAISAFGEYFCIRITVEGCIMKDKCCMTNKYR
ncbi:phospholipase [Trichinella spiralis]|uniref:phospholipase n=1 Tax=Trichinella spiralis TaxID=6334 RepID=UPI0001EFD2F7|nr:phospholipase [Trichinella spiralis]